MTDGDRGLRELLDSTLDAIDELRLLTSRDPLAGRAIEAIRLTRHTLESMWLPALCAHADRMRDPASNRATGAGDPPGQPRCRTGRPS